MSQLRSVVILQGAVCI